MSIESFSENEISSGLFSLKNLPQRGSVSHIAQGTGWWELDQIFKLYPGQLVVVTGIPGSGKSTFMLNMLANLSRTADFRSMLFVPENEAHLREKMERIWGDRPGFDKFCGEQCWVQSAVASDYEAPAQTLSWILDQAIAGIKHAGVDLLLIDPWNELEWARRPKDQTATEYIGECLKLIKYFSRMYDVAVVVVTHPTKDVGRDGKARNITLYDIDGSAHWYNKCDNGLIVVREPGTRATKVISAKVREKGAGKIGVCFFDVDPETEVFTPQIGAVST